MLTAPPPPPSGALVKKPQNTRWFLGLKTSSYMCTIIIDKSLLLNVYKYKDKRQYIDSCISSRNPLLLIHVNVLLCLLLSIVIIVLVILLVLLCRFLIICLTLNIHLTRNVSGLLVFRNLSPGGLWPRAVLLSKQASILIIITNKEN